MMKKIFILIILACFISGCGQLGRLYLPKYKRDTRSGWYDVEDY